jgi:thymidylate synthase ThyX
MYSVKIIKDSLAPCKRRLTTFEIRYQRFIHAELMTHRLFSRNAASSRAIPVEKMLQRIEENPAKPIWWGANEPGMKAKAELEGEALLRVQDIWHQATEDAIFHARQMLTWGAHKQIVNRIVEPFSLITTIVTATNFENFFTLRYHKDAQPEFGYLAKLMADVYYNSEPMKVWTGFWHLPYIQEDEWDTNVYDIETLKKVSVARCARVSYLTHDGTRAIEKDLELFENLRSGSGFGHWSPFEHVAQALQYDLPSGNFRGWEQYRKRYHNECHDNFDYQKAREQEMFLPAEVNG